MSPPTSNLNDQGFSLKASVTIKVFSESFTLHILKSIHLCMRKIQIFCRLAIAINLLYKTLPIYSRSFTKCFRSTVNGKIVNKGLEDLENKVQMPKLELFELL